METFVIIRGKQPGLQYSAERTLASFQAIAGLLHLMVRGSKSNRASIKELEELETRPFASKQVERISGKSKNLHENHLIRRLMQRMRTTTAY